MTLKERVLDRFKEEGVEEGERQYALFIEYLHNDFDGPRGLMQRFIDYSKTNHGILKVGWYVKDDDSWWEVIMVNMSRAIIQNLKNMSETKDISPYSELPVNKNED